MASVPRPPPETRRESIEELVHGTRVDDPYRWLESGDSPEVRAWTEAQTRYARDVLDALPERGEIRASLEGLFAIGGLSPPTPRGDRLFFTQRTGDQEQPILKLLDAATGSERTLVDPTADGDETRALDWYYPSPDGTLMAFGLSREGSEQSTLSVMDVSNAELLDDEIPFTRACSLAWLPDTTGFFYSRYPDPGSVAPGEEAYHRHLFEHRLGAAWRDDRYVFGRDRPVEDWPNVQLSPDGRWLVATVSRGWSRTDVYLHNREGGGGFYPVIEGVEALFGVTPRDDRLLIHTNLDAPRHKLMAADPDALAPERWKTVIPERRDVLQATAQVGDTVLALWLHDASSRLTLHDADGRGERVLQIPELGSIASLTGEWNGSVAFFDFSSYATPTSIHRIDLRSRETTLWRSLEVPFDPGEFRVRLTHYSSKDGTRISMFLVDRKDRPDDGTGPAVLNGYGGFNVSLTPSFGRSLVDWLERGGLFAVPHLRGGGEYGEEWHRAGMLDRKQNVFDDFIAAGEALVAQGLVASDRLAIMGGKQWRPARRRRIDAASGAVPGRRLPGPPARHGPLPPFSHRPPLDSRVRNGRGRGGVPVALRLLALPPCRRRDELPRRTHHDGRVRQPCRSDARAQDGRDACKPPRGRAGPFSCAPNRAPATDRASRSPACSRSGPTCGASSARNWPCRGTPSPNYSSGFVARGVKRQPSRASAVDERGVGLSVRRRSEERTRPAQAAYRDSQQKAGE